MHGGKALSIHQSLQMWSGWDSHPTKRRNGLLISSERTIRRHSGWPRSQFQLKTRIVILESFQEQLYCYSSRQRLHGASSQMRHTRRGIFFSGGVGTEKTARCGTLARPLLILKIRGLILPSRSATPLPGGRIIRWVRHRCGSGAETKAALFLTSGASS